MNSAGEIIGEAVFTETKKGVKIHVAAEKLEPGTKAIHIHKTGTCDLPDFKSAGAHFNPAGKEHGFHNPKGFHVGDLPNIKVPQSGEVDVTTVAPGVKLGKDSLLDADGSALIIHEKADDYKTDPARKCREPNCLLIHSRSLKRFSLFKLFFTLISPASSIK